MLLQIHAGLIADSKCIVCDFCVVLYENLRETEHYFIPPRILGVE